MRWLRVGFLPLSLLTLVSAALIVPLPFYLERPGRTLSLGACVDVTADGATLDGDFLLTTINVLPATTVDTVRGAATDDAQIIPRRELVPPGVESDAFFDQQRQLFASTADVAAAVALEAAGYEVTMAGDGVEVVRVLPDTPADGVLRPEDVIRAIDGEPVTVETQLREAIERSEVGNPLRFRVEREGETVELEVAPEEIQGMPVIGILPQTLDPRVDLPVDVDVATGPIGGPSAGLMIALTVYDKVLPDVDLTAGRLVAGTGSISQNGRVGPIGGIGLKVLAADAQGVDIFLTPRADQRTALAAVPVGSPLRIVAVETFDEAVDALLETAGEVSRRDAVEPDGCPYPSGTPAAAAPRR